MIEEGLAMGMYTMALPLQIVAHSPNALAGMHASYLAIFGRSVVGPRICELMRLRSAQLAACEPCSLSRKDASVSEDDVACLAEPERLSGDRRELLAVRLVDLMATDHHAIDDDFLRELASVFTVEEIVEMGWYAGTLVGGHRFMHMLDVLGDSRPVVGPVAST
jgi:alkylhydroperoxidase family enzyme